LYGFDRHKGYNTDEHERALAEHGPSPVHRYSFVNVNRAAVQGDPLAPRDPMVVQADPVAPIDPVDPMELMAAVDPADAMDLLRR
jgi:ribonuclease HII